MDYGLSLLSIENLTLKKKILNLLIKKSRTFERLMELGTKHAVQSSLYDLEQEGFITRRIRTENETNIYYYIFNRTKLLFKIQKDLEENHRKMKEIMEFYTSNYLFYCDHCKKLFEYSEAMEAAFGCCGDKMISFDSTDIIQKITDNMAYIERKLDSLAKI
ncbi:MAG: hypothetical protein ACFFD2_03630 [Promethearchaeota archaeon]